MGGKVNGLVLDHQLLKHRLYITVIVRGSSGVSSKYQDGSSGDSMSVREDKLELVCEMEWAVESAKMAQSSSYISFMSCSCSLAPINTALRRLLERTSTCSDCSGISCSLVTVFALIFD